MIISEPGIYNLTADQSEVDIIQLAGGEITVELVLDKPGVQATVRAITVGQVDQTAKLTVNLRHQAPETTAAFEGRALLRGSSHLEFRGLIEIEASGRQTESFLTHRSLLRDEASVTPIPSLEIKNDEVKASHAASVTKLDEETLFFLRSRGLSNEAAVTLLTDAFLNDILAKLPTKWQKIIASTTH